MQDGREHLLDWLREDYAGSGANIFRTTKLGPGGNYFRVILLEGDDGAFVYEFPHKSLLHSMRGNRTDLAGLAKWAGHGVIWRYDRPHLFSNPQNRIIANTWLDVLLFLLAFGAVLTGLLVWDLPFGWLPASDFLAELTFGLIVTVMLILPYAAFKILLTRISSAAARSRNRSRAEEFDKKLVSAQMVYADTRFLADEERQVLEVDYREYLEHEEARQEKRQLRKSRLALSWSALRDRLISQKYKRVLGPFSPWVRAAFFPRTEHGATYRESYSSVASKWWTVPIFTVVVTGLIVIMAVGLVRGDAVIEIPPAVYQVLLVIAAVYYLIVLAQFTALSILRHRVRGWRKRRYAERQKRLLDDARELRDTGDLSLTTAIHRRDDFLTQKQLIW